MKKDLLLLLLLFLPIVANADSVGKCGANLTWTYVDATKTLTISGSGPMDNYACSACNPWVDTYKVSTLVIEEGVTTIGDNAFSHLSLTSVIIPSSVTTIGKTAFYGCSSLTSITIPNSVTAIYSAAFWYCSSLTSITIPNSVTTIGNSAFNNCTSLTSAVLPNALTLIGSDVFYNCSSLTNISIPNTVSTIDESTFYGCSSLTSITIPNSVTTIGGAAFKGCSNLTSITIPNSVTAIGNAAFESCSSLTSITIPNSVTTIGNNAFKNCTSLTSVVFPNALTLIGSGMFYNCSSLTNISIPNTISTIDESAFSGCSSLTSITIPNSVTTIGNNAFKNCTSLTSVVFPNALTLIGSGMFYNCSSLTNISIPNTISTIDESAFSGCSSLTSITIPNSVNSIGNNAFEGCSSLASVTLHCNVISSWFKGFPKIKEVIIGEEVAKIDNGAFSNCSAISTIEIGKGIKEIGERAFAGINKLTDVYCYAEEVPNTDRTAFENSYLDYVTLHVPYPSIETYKSVGPWKYFKEILTLPKDTYTLTFVVDGQVYKTLELLPGATITPEVEPTKEGYTFSGWSDISETMPAQDVTITGTFTIKKYNLNYIVDGENYKSSEIEYDATITPEAAPTKEGYTFSGWSEIPETMPAYDVTVTGSFTINSYKLTYIVDGEEYKSIEVEYNTSITPETDPTKDGYDFSGWSEIPETMPAYDVTITGSFERRYDVGNVTSLISFILRGNGGSDDLAIYDMNGDGVLDIGDLILVVRKVLNSTTRSAATRANVDCLTPDLTQYSAAQFVLNAPESVREQDIRLAGGIEQTHQIMCKQIEPGAYAVVVYSLTNSLFTPVDGGIIEVNDGKAHSGDLYIQDVLLAKPTGETKRYDNMPVATKISDVEKENGHRQVYDLKGQKQNRTDGLQKGVYIENGKKIVVR